MDWNERRRIFAEEIQVTSNVRGAAVLEALAAVPRERFLPPGPWTIRSEADFGGPPRQTPSADPGCVYHNVSVAIDPGRMLFNGAPGVMAMAIDAASLSPGQRVLHIGAGTGYFTALAGHCVGPSGRVVAIEVDGELAKTAAANVASMPWIDVRCGDGSGPLDEPFDAILVNAGVTHVPPAWLDALEPSGRIVVPLTATIGPSSPISKGVMIVLTRTADPARLAARMLTFVAIYSAVGLRDEALGRDVAVALKGNPMPALKHLRRDPHERCASCWVHTDVGCWSTE